MVFEFIVKYSINTMIARLSVILTKMEIFVLLIFFCSFVNKKSKFDNAISFLWFIPETNNKKPYVLSVLTLRTIEAI